MKLGDKVKRYTKKVNNIYVVSSEVIKRKVIIILVMQLKG